MLLRCATDGNLGLDYPLAWEVNFSLNVALNAPNSKLTLHSNISAYPAKNSFNLGSDCLACSVDLKKYIAMPLSGAMWKVSTLVKPFTHVRSALFSAQSWPTPMIFPFLYLKWPIITISDMFDSLKATN